MRRMKVMTLTFYFMTLLACGGEAAREEAGIEPVTETAPLPDVDEMSDGAAQNGTGELTPETVPQDADASVLSDTVVIVADVDSDGVPDEADVCPDASNADQSDLDGDGLGDLCDTDLDGDGIADDAVFVSESGSSDAYGSSARPVSRFDLAIAFAVQRAMDIKVAVGSYDVTGVSFADGVSLYGGYAADFSERDVSRIEEASVLTAHASGGAESVVSLDGFSNGATISGFVFRGVEGDSPEVLVSLADTSVTFSDVSFAGDAALVSQTLLTASVSEITIQRCTFFGAASNVATGLAAMDSVVTLVSSLFSMGDGDNTMALSLASSQAILVNDTVDGGRHDEGTAFGISFQSSSLAAMNTVFLTQAYDSQASLRCQGDAAASFVSLKDNFFARYSSDSTAGLGSGYVFPAYVTCAGRKSLTTDSQLESGAYGELDANGNVVWEILDVSDSTGGVASLFDDDFRPVVDSPLIGAGASVTGLGAEWDYFGVPRGAIWDLGAVAFGNNTDEE